MIRLLFILSLILLFGTQNVHAQKEDVVEISGVVVSNDSLKQFIPNCYIIIPKRGQVSTSNNDGFFSIVAVLGDTVEFSHIGFETQKLWVTDTLHNDDTYLTVVVLNWDRAVLDPVIVYPWPSPENFKREFLAMQLPMTEYDIAQRNLAIQTLKEQAAAMGYDADEMQDYMMGLQNQNMYNYNRMYGGGPGAGGGAAILGAISNPFAWAQFFDALKRGDFKSK